MVADDEGGDFKEVKNVLVGVDDDILDVVVNHHMIALASLVLVRVVLEFLDDELDDQFDLAGLEVELQDFLFVLGEQFLHKLKGFLCG